MNTYMSLTHSGKGRKIIAIAILSNMEFSPRIRELVLSVIRNNTKFSSRWAYRLQSVIDELVNNAIEHGSDGHSLVTISLFLDPIDGSLEVTITDAGTGNKKITAEVLTKKMYENYELMKINPLTNTTIRGRGLAQIVINWSDTFEIQDNVDGKGGLTVKVVKNLTPDCQEVKKVSEELTPALADIGIEVSIM
ncbi:MAG: ATP-binding protein [Candidatus Gracilibacteria bacterium]